MGKCYYLGLTSQETNVLHPYRTDQAPHLRDSRLEPTAEFIAGCVLGPGKQDENSHAQIVDTGARQVGCRGEAAAADPWGCGTNANSVARNCILGSKCMTCSRR